MEEVGIGLEEDKVGLDLVEKVQVDLGVGLGVGCYLKLDLLTVVPVDRQTRSLTCQHQGAPEAIAQSLGDSNPVGLGAGLELVLELQELPALELEYIRVALDVELAEPLELDLSVPLGPTSPRLSPAKRAHDPDLSQVEVVSLPVREPVNS